MSIDCDTKSFVADGV